MLAYWGIGLHWGRAVSNNKQGHLIGHIKDIGAWLGVGRRSARAGRRVHTS